MNLLKKKKLQPREQGTSVFRTTYIWLELMEAPVLYNNTLHDLVHVFFQDRLSQLLSSYEMVKSRYMKMK